MKKIILVIALILFTFPSNCLSNGFPNKGDIYWLTQNIYHESRGEIFYGQLMIGLVTLERLHSGRWGDTIKSVVIAPAQFSWHSDGKSDVPDNQEAWNIAKGLAMMSLMMYDSIAGHGIMHYHNNTVNPYWAKEMTEVITVGNHTFYKEK